MLLLAGYIKTSTRPNHFYEMARSFTRKLFNGLITVILPNPKDLHFIAENIVV